MSVIADMQEYMDRVRGYFERARAVRRFSERVSPAQFGARDRRLLAVDMRTVSGEGSPVEKLGEYHVRLLEAETTVVFGGIRLIAEPRALNGHIVQVRR
ncbi:MAG TPA: hypothetical protein PKD63_00125 [Solirubrobacteraceae bacterium]|nr:hypothetical protein [Solirubrobacteraceae bacterium]